VIKRGIFCILMSLTVNFSGFSDEVTVTGTAPTFKTDDPAAQEHIGFFNDYLESAFNSMLGDITDMSNTILPPGLVNSANLLNGFGTSSVFSSHGATMRAYADYKFLSISIGSMVGLKLPENTTNSFLNGKMDFGKLMTDNSIFGINPQFLSIHVGFNPSALIEVFPKNLFFGLRIGFFGLPNLSIPIENATVNLDFNVFTIGITFNYQLVSTLGIDDIIKWRGVNIGSGLIFQTTKLDLSIPLDQIDAPIGTGGGLLAGGPLDNLTLVVDPMAIFNININTFTIPIEVMSSIKLLFLNIPFGLGFDIGFGRSALSADAQAGVNIEGVNSDLLTQDKSGSLSVDIKNNDIAPTAFNFKIMIGLGLTFGDRFVIDIPLTLYIKDGFNLGVNLGLRF